MHVTAQNEDKASVKQATARYAPALLSSPSHQPVFANEFLKSKCNRLTIRQQMFYFPAVFVGGGNSFGRKTHNFVTNLVKCKNKKVLCNNKIHSCLKTHQG